MHPDTLGIDIAKETFSIALYRNDEYQVGEFANTPAGYKKLANWLKKRKVAGCRAGLEATGRYGQALALFLHAAGFQVSIINPAQIKAYAASQLKRNKTDPEDAKVVAHFCATQQPPLWTPPSAAAHELQLLVRRLENLKAMRTQELNRRQAGLVSQAVLASINNHLTFLETQIAALEDEIKQWIDDHPDLKKQRDLLISIKGISHTTAAKFLAEVPDIQLFASAGQLAAYAGVTPRIRRSGTSVRGPSHFSKMGNIHLRTAFYMPAMSAMRSNPIVKALVHRLQQRGKPAKVIIGAVMRKLIHLAYGVLKTGVPFDPDYLANVQGTS